MTTHLFFSNRYQEIADRLGKRLFIPSSSPLLKKYVVVESSAVKDWLMLYYATHADIQMCAGVSFVSVEEIAILFSKRSFPSQLEIFFALIEELHVFSDFSEKEKVLFEPVLAYLNVEAPNQKKLLAFAQTLSSFLSDYGLYKKKEGAEETWQEALWKKIYLKREWLYPLLLLEKSEERENLEIHLFDIQFLPQVYCEFFHKAAKRNSIFYYLLSPCELYWGDNFSDRELKVLKNSYKKKGKVSDDIRIFEERNALLGNFGKLQREFLRFLDEYDSHLEEYYDSSNEKRSTLLKKIQDDLLNLTYRPKSEKIELLKDDNSLQIHLCGGSIIRELQILKDRLIHFYHQEGVFQSSDILVLAPDIQSYIPYIHLVFGGEEAHFDYKILEDNSLSHNALLFGIMNLLELPEKEGETHEIEALWENPFFQKRYALSLDDIEIWKGWISQAKTRFGINKEGYHTWDHTLSRLLAAVVFEYDEEKDVSEFPYPLAGFDFTQLESVDKLCRFLSFLKEDLSFLKKNPTFTLFGWTQHLERIISTYFAWKLTGDEKSSYQEVEKLFHTFKRASLSFPSEKFDFHSVFSALKKEIKKKKGKFQGSHQNAIRFASLKNGSVLPAKILCLIGMEEGAFPRFSPSLSLQEAQENSPKKQTEDRFLFLRALFLAEEKLLFTYKHMSSDDGRKIGSSLALQELCTYLDENFSVGEKKCSEVIIQNHPILPFDSSSFDEKNPHIRSYSPAFYKALQKQGEKKTPELLQFPLPLSEVSFTESTVDVNHLLKLSRDPWKFYLNETLGIYLEKNEKGMFQSEEFFFSKLDEYLLKKSALKRPWAEVVEQLEKKGKLPLALFGESAKGRIARDFSHWEKTFTEMGIEKESLFSIQFMENIRESKELKPHVFALPPLKVPISETHKVSLLGEIPMITKNGLVLLQENSAEKMFQNWPLIVTYLSLPSEFLPKNPKIFFAKKNTSKEIAIDDPLQALAKFINYFMQVKNSLSPLRSEWIQGFLQNDPGVLEKKIEASSRKEDRNHYVNWLLEGRKLPPAELLLSDWSSYFKNIFSPFQKLYEKGSEDSNEF